MSHRTCVETKISNKSSLENALKKLNISYKTNAKTKSAYIDSEECDFVLEKYGNENLNDAIGIKKTESGNFEIAGDFYGLQDSNGKILNKDLLNERITNAYNFEQLNTSIGNLGFNVDNLDIDFNSDKLNYVASRVI